MKNTIYIFTAALLVVVSLPLIFGFQVQNNNALPIGTVIYSVLQPETFMKLNGRENWVTLEGQELDRNLPIAKYFQRKKLPNANGLFIRSANYNSNGFDDNNRQSPFDIQQDMTSLPKNAFIINEGNANEHYHHLYLYEPFNQDGVRYRNGKNCKGCDILSGVNVHADFQGDASKLGRIATEPRTLEINGGDPETRPKNIALYTYLKIR